MKSWTNKLLLSVFALCFAASLRADDALAPANNFEEETIEDEPIVSGVGTYWYNSWLGELAEHTDTDDILTSTDGRRSDKFDWDVPNTYRFTVNSGKAVIFRTILPNKEVEGSGYRMQSLEIKDDDVVYLDALVKFRRSPAPDPGEDKLILWANKSGELCVTAGYYAKSFAGSGVVATNYVAVTNGNMAVTVDDGSWHRVVVEFFRPLKLDYYNSGFVIYFDGAPLAVDPAASIVSEELSASLQSLLTDEGRRQYEARTLFPTLRVDLETQKLTGLGMSGTGGGVDEIVVSTNETPNVVGNYKAPYRYFLLSWDPGIDSFTWQIDSGMPTDVAPGGKRGETAIAVPVAASGTCKVAIGDIKYASDEYTGVNLSTTDSASEVSCDNDNDSFTVPQATGYDLLHGKLEPVNSSTKMCQLTYTEGDTPQTQYFDSIQAAIDKLLPLEVTDAKIQLLRSQEENVVVTNVAFTLDLSGRTLTGPGEDIPTIKVGQDGYLTVKDSGTGGTVAAYDTDMPALSRNSNAQNVTLEGGRYLNPVSNRREAGQESNLIFAGGKYYANGGEGGFEMYSGEYREGYAGEWIGADHCWSVHEVATLSAAPQLSATAALLGMSGTDADKMLVSGSMPEIVITDIVSTIENEQTVVTCLIAVTIDNEPVESVSLADFVRVSKDLESWTMPETIVYTETEDPGVWQVKITLSDADEYFICISDK